MTHIAAYAMLPPTLFYIKHYVFAESHWPVQMIDGAPAGWDSFDRGQWGQS